MKKLVCLLLAITFLIGCTTNSNDKSIKIAEQYGLAYAPLQIMKEKGYLEDALEGVEIEWVQLGNTAAIREAMLAGKVDVGFVGIPPFLIGLDNGMDWKIMCGLSTSPLGLVTNKEHINNLNDFTFKDKIALPQPGSIQHILLSMAAEKQLGDAKAFDNQLITMSHPDGVIALDVGNEISAHFTSPPYLFTELDNPKHHLVLTGEEAVGETFTFIVGVATSDFYNKSTYYKSMLESIEKSIDYMENNPEETISILADTYSIDENTLKGYISSEGLKYTKDIYGVGSFIDFMSRNGYINKKYNIEEVIWNY